MASPRVQCWALILAAYDYHIVYKPGMANANAGTLSHLPRAQTGPDAPILGEVILLMDTMESSPITPMHVHLLRGRDPVLSRIHEYTIGGWPGTLPQEEFKPFASHKQELSVNVGCVLL